MAVTQNHRCPNLLGLRLNVVSKIILLSFFLFLSHASEPQIISYGLYFARACHLLKPKTPSSLPYTSAPILAPLQLHYIQCLLYILFPFLESFHCLWNSDSLISTLPFVLMLFRQHFLHLLSETWSLLTDTVAVTSCIFSSTLELVDLEMG